VPSEDEPYSPTSPTCANVPRVSALLNIATGTLDSSTISNDIYNTNNPRGVYTQNGSSFYLSGQGAGASDEGGLYLDAFGNNTTTGGSAPTGIFNKESTRTVSAWNIDAANGVASTTPNLYYAADQNSSSKGTLTGLFEYTGLPTSSEGSSSGTRITPVTATIGGKTVNLSPQGYFFANPTTLYIADTGDPKAGGTGAGGIQKWGFNGSSWVLLYEFANPSGFVAPASATSVSHGETGMEALAGQVVNGVASLYAVSYTAGDADPNGLYGVTDTVSFTTSAQASPSLRPPPPRPFPNPPCPSGRSWASPRCSSPSPPVSCRLLAAKRKGRAGQPRAPFAK
jgi:hypothetical protein